MWPCKSSHGAPVIACFHLSQSWFSSSSFPSFHLSQPGGLLTGSHPTPRLLPVVARKGSAWGWNPGGAFPGWGGGSQLVPAVSHFPVLPMKFPPPTSLGRSFLKLWLERRVYS